MTRPEHRGDEKTVALPGNRRTPAPGTYSPQPRYPPISHFRPPPVPGPPVFPAAPPPAAQPIFSRRWLIPVFGGAAIILIALVAVVIARPGPVKPVLADKLNIAAAQTAVQGVLTDPTAGYGLHDVNDVICNHGVNPVIAKGTTFTCEFTVDGHQLQATMTFLDDAGAYSVGRPQ